MKPFIFAVLPVTAAMFFAHEIALAAPLDPIDCPCYQEMIDAAALADRTVIPSFNSYNFKKGEYIKQLTYVGNAGESCAEMTLTNINAEKRIAVVVGTAGFFGVCSSLPAICEVQGLTDVEAKACDTLIKVIKQELQHLRLWLAADPLN